MVSLGPRCCNRDSGNIRWLFVRHGGGWLRLAGLGIRAVPISPRAGIVMRIPDCLRRGVSRTEATICSYQPRAGTCLS